MASVEKDFNMIYDFNIEGTYTVSSNGSITVSLTEVNSKDYNIEVRVSSGQAKRYLNITPKKKSITFSNLPKGSYSIFLINQNKKESVGGKISIKW
ncbi:hypothetical protein ABE137_01395 [Brevibacillus laterosporus]|uniref:hypothetical protein n=1 Tax=Brevibacillus laterosporus TaxID=1465 RepID=UPI003D19B293